MQAVEAAILRTVLYADVFNFPLRLEEIHHFLIHDQPISLKQISETLDYSTWLRQKISHIDEFYVYEGRQELVSVRQQREAASRLLWPKAQRWGKRLAELPYIRMVAITGALAVHNAAHDQDDLDYILVTAEGRVWIARAFAILLVRIGALRGAKLCPNFVLSENALGQTKQNIFIAHEVAQMIPLHGQIIYQQFRHENEWVTDHLPNATRPYFDESEHHPNFFNRWAKRGVEKLLGGGLGDRLEYWEQQRKIRRFEQDMRLAHSAAKLDHTQVKGHFNDHGHPILTRYYERLRECGLDNILALTGD